ncbi:MAG TPA: hypothetical protein VF530_00190 [Planctomycetota bacterium]
MLSAPAEAQRKGGKKKGGAAAAAGKVPPRKGKAGKDGPPAKGAAGAKAPVAPTPKVGLTPRPPRPTASPSARAALWASVVDGLGAAYAARHPDRALEHARGAPGSFALGTAGTLAGIRWRDALLDALTGLTRLEESAGADTSTSLQRRLVDWVQLELLLLDAQAEAAHSPTRYVQRAARTLRAAAEAHWLKPEPRQRELAALVAALPEYLRDARVSLVSPAPEEIDSALLELEDLRELLAALAPTLAGARPPAGKSARDLEAAPALEGFRNWLVEQRDGAGGEPPRLEPAEWERCVRLATGRAWSTGELKARALRELARLDVTRPEPHRERPRRPDPQELVQHVAAAAEHAVRVGLAAHVLHDTTDPRLFELRVDTSPRAAWRELVLQPGQGGRWLGTLLLPHPSWSPARTAARNAELRLEHAAALGVRHGLAGETYGALLARAAKDLPPMLRDARLVPAGLGLYALDWIGRVAHDANPFHGDESLERAFARQRGREAARLLAALELHGEGLARREARVNFQRRTGADEDAAAAEIRAALRDPLHGIAYLGLLELLALEERVAGHIEPRRAPRLVLLLLARNAGLRPADLVIEPGLLPEKPEDALEFSGPAKNEASRSR